MKISQIVIAFSTILFSQNSIAQNVGIGTTSPAAKLEITHNGASTYGTALLINQEVIGNSDGPKIQFKKTMTSSKSWTAGILNGIDVGTFGISEDGGTGGFGTPRFTIAQGGNIGIGTVMPAFPLSFNQNIGDKISIWSNSTNSYGFGIQSSLMQIHTDISAADIAFGYGSSPAFTETMRIKGNGNVGIGTTTPGNILEIKNSGATTPGLRINNTTATWQLGVGVNSANDALFGIYNSSAGNALVINSSGNVGIGNTNPQFPLDVNGRIRLSGTNPNDPGIWLNDASADRAFIGLQNTDQVGFYGGNGGIGWGLTMNTLTGALAINGNTGTVGQILQSNGSGAAPAWINPIDPNALKTKYYQTYINSFVLTDASSLTINVPVTVYSNSIITVSVTVNVSTATFFGCTNGELSLTIEPLGGGGLVATAGKFLTQCGATKNTFTSGELPLLASNGTMKIFGPGTGIGAVVRFVKTNSGPDLSIGNTTPAVIIVKVVPQ